MVRPPFWHVVRRGILGWLWVGLLAGAVLGLATASTGGQVGREISSCWCRAGSRTRWPPGWWAGRRGLVLRVGEWVLLRPGGRAGRWPDGRARPAPAPYRRGGDPPLIACPGGPGSRRRGCGRVARGRGDLPADGDGVRTVIALLLGQSEGALVGAVAGVIGAPFFAASADYTSGSSSVQWAVCQRRLRERSAPNQGIRRSARTAVLVGLGTGLLYLLALSAVSALLASVPTVAQGWPVDWRADYPPSSWGRSPVGCCTPSSGASRSGAMPASHTPPCAWSCGARAVFPCRPWTSWTTPPGGPSCAGRVGDTSSCTASSRSTSPLRGREPRRGAPHDQNEAPRQNLSSLPLPIGSAQSGGLVTPR